MKGSCMYTEMANFGLMVIIEAVRLTEMWRVSVWVPTDMAGGTGMDY